MRGFIPLIASVTPSPEELPAIAKKSPLLVALAQRYDGSQYRQFRREGAEQIMRLLDHSLGTADP
jgi:hypothetical protein